MIENWFSTPIGFVYTDNISSINREVENYISSLKNAKLGNPWGDNLDTTFSYDSVPMINCPILLQWATDSVKDYVLETCERDCTVTLKESWINLYEENGYQNFHDHVENFRFDVSAVYYHEVCEGGGDLQFKDSSPIQRNARFPNGKYPLAVTYKAEAGKLIMFPSYLEHRVVTIKKGKRSSIAMNFTVDM